MKISFETNWKNREVFAYLLIEYITYGSDYNFAEIELSHGEDLHTYTNIIHKNNYQQLAEDINEDDIITDVKIVGLKIRAVNNKAKYFYHLQDSLKHASIEVSSELLKDINEDKMSRILEIIKE